MPQSALEMAKELVLAQVQLGQLQAEQVPDALRQTHASLAELKAQEDIGTTTVAPTNETPPVDWRKSITKHAVTCLECGQSFKQLSIVSGCVNVYQNGQFENAAFFRHETCCALTV